MMKVDRRQFVKLGGTLLLSALAPWEAFCLPGGIPVLVYHDIADKYGDPYTITPSLFSAQMEWLYGNGFHAVAVRDIPERAGDGKSFVLTFDDGYASYMDYAFPLFREYGFHSTINIIGSLVGLYLDVEGNRPLLSWDEYRYLLDSGRVDLGCQTYELYDESRQGVSGVSGKTNGGGSGKVPGSVRKGDGRFHGYPRLALRTVRPGEDRDRSTGGIPVFPHLPGGTLGGDGREPR